MARKTQRRSMLPLVMMVLGGILILGALGWTIYSLLQPEQQSTQLGSSEANSDADIPRVSLGDAKAAYDTGSAVFVDVRDLTFFELGHIPGSVSIPLNELPARLSELDQNDWIITYCS